MHPEYLRRSSLSRRFANQQVVGIDSDAEAGDLSDSADSRWHAAYGAMIDTLDALHGLNRVTAASRADLLTDIADRATFIFRLSGDQARALAERAVNAALAANKEG